jgi:D-lactate dehydrogenase
MIEADPSDLPMTVIDSIEFARTHILPRLPDHAKLESLALHPTCSSTRLGINASLEAVARAVADRVQIPENWGCCAFAGDRAMLHPELTASAASESSPEGERPADATLSRRPGQEPRSDRRMAILE